MPRRKHTLSEAELNKLQNIIADYSRVSTDSEDQANSLENQLYYFKNAAKNANKIHYKSFWDEGLTGTKLNNRQGFNLMLHDAGIDVVDSIDPRTMKKVTSYYISEYRNPKFGQIWVKNTSRFARNTFSFEIIQILRRNNVFVYFLEQNILTNDTTHDFELKLWQNFDENESRSKGKKVRFGYQQGAKKGRIYVGSGLFGYKYNADDNTLKQTKDAATVKLIFKLYLQGLGIRKIRNYLFEHNIKSATGKEKWGYTSLKNMLKNEKYAGYNNPLKFDAGEVLVDKHYSKVKENYECYPCDNIEAIITWEEFLKVKEMMSQKCDDLNNPTRGRKKSYSKYNQLLYCYKCHNHFIRNADYYDVAKTRKYYFYNCSTKRKEGRAHCDNVNVKEDDVTKFIQQLGKGEYKKMMEYYNKNYCFMLLRVADYLIEDIDVTANKQAEEILFNIEETRSKLDNIAIKMIENPGLNVSGVFDRMIEKYNAELEELQKKYEELNSYNDNIYKTIFQMIDMYKELEAADENLKERYSEKEMITLLDKIYVEELDGKAKLVPVFRYFSEADKILKPFEVRYNFRTENLQRTKNVDYALEINTYYTKLKNELDGVYAM